MSTIHRTGLAIAALVTIAILAGAVVAQGYYAALAQATPEPTPGPAATDTPAPSFTPSPEVPVVYIAAPTSPPTTPPRPAVARVPVQGGART